MIVQKEFDVMMVINYLTKYTVGYRVIQPCKFLKYNFRSPHPH